MGWTGILSSSFVLRFRFRENIRKIRKKSIKHICWCCLFDFLWIRVFAFSEILRSMAILNVSIQFTICEIQNYQQCHRWCHSTTIDRRINIYEIQNRLMTFSSTFSPDSLGAKSQIISAAVCANISMELCDAWIGAHGISLSEHVSTHFSLRHVLSVRR